jgi:branched-chain amino acid aminotransferase
MSGQGMSNPVAVWVTRLDSEKVDIHPVQIPAHLAGLDAVTTSLPGGAYTTIRTYQGDRLLRLQDQVLRLEQSASLAGKPLRLDEARLRWALRKVIAQAHAQFGARFSSGKKAGLRLRLTLDLESQPGDLYIAIEPLEVPPPAAYRDGVSVITCSLERLLPQAKLTRFIARSRPIRQSLPPRINEAVMVSPEGFLLEGLTSNFFAVSQGEIRTAQQAVLSGITRGLVLEGARRLGLAVRFRPVHLSEIAHLQGAFITSSSRGVLPVIRIDAIQIGNGKPDPLTRRLEQAYDEIILEQLEPIG